MSDLISLADVLILAGMALTGFGIYLIDPLYLLVYAGLILMIAGYLRMRVT